MAMSRHVGVRRDATSLERAGDALAAVARSAVVDAAGDRSSWETTNLVTVASAVVAAATARTESRGCHRRTDHPEPQSEWLVHLDVGLAADATVEATVADALPIF
jgi:L-aspartate oxidase